MLNVKVPIISRRESLSNGLFRGVAIWQGIDDQSSWPERVEVTLRRSNHCRSNPRFEFENADLLMELPRDSEALNAVCACCIHTNKNDCDCEQACLALSAKHREVQRGQEVLSADPAWHTEIVTMESVKYPSERCCGNSLDFGLISTRIKSALAG